MTKTNTTLEITTAALAPTESALRNCFHERLVKHYDAFAAQLSADGMDAQISFAYPNSLKVNSRSDYAYQVGRYNYCQSHTISLNESGCRNPNGPDNRKFHQREPLLARFMIEAAKAAKATIESYCVKLAKKIDGEAKGAKVLTVTYHGFLTPWQHSFINVETSAGAQVWKTQMIVNVSCLGKLFNQWPTRLAPTQKEKIVKKATTKTAQAVNAAFDKSAVKGAIKGKAPKAPAAPVAQPNRQFYAGGVESPSAQKMLARINKATSEKPLVASKAFGKKQYPNRVARMLATLGLVVQEKRDDLGVVFYAK